MESVVAAAAPPPPPAAAVAQVWHSSLAFRHVLLHGCMVLPRAPPRAVEALCTLHTASDCALARFSLVSSSAIVYTQRQRRESATDTKSAAQLQRLQHEVCEVSTLEKWSHFPYSHITLAQLACPSTFRVSCIGTSTLSPAITHNTTSICQLALKHKQQTTTNKPNEPTNQQQTNQAQPRTENMVSGEQHPLLCPLCAANRIAPPPPWPGSHCTFKEGPEGAL